MSLLTVLGAGIESFDSLGGWYESCDSIGGWYESFDSSGGWYESFDTDHHTGVGERTRTGTGTEREWEKGEEMAGRGMGRRERERERKTTVERGMLSGVTVSPRCRSLVRPEGQRLPRRRHKSETQTRGKQARQRESFRHLLCAPTKSAAWARLLLLSSLFPSHSTLLPHISHLPHTRFNKGGGLRTSEAMKFDP
jgi:hypothetical protein